MLQPLKYHVQTSRRPLRATQSPTQSSPWSLLQIPDFSAIPSILHNTMSSHYSQLKFHYRSQIKFNKASWSLDLGKYTKNIDIAQAGHNSEHHIGVLNKMGLCWSITTIGLTD